VTPTRHSRKPIRKHGPLHDHFTMIPNELARDATLSNHAYRIAIVMRSHQDGWEISAASLAKDHGLGARDRREGTTRTRGERMACGASLPDSEW
jgi:hypothetical protein